MDALAAYGSSSSSDDAGPQGQPPPPPPRPAAFAVHVKTPAPLDTAAVASLTSLAARVTAAVPAATADPRLASGDPLHVSMSRGAALPSIGAATALLDALASVLADAKPFELTLTGVHVLLGGGGKDASTPDRVFICVGGGAPDPHFSAFVRAVDDAVALSDLPAFHAVPLPHISVASAPAADADAVRAAVAGVEAAPVTVAVRSVECSVGNRSHVVWRAP